MSKIKKHFHNEIESHMRAKITMIDLKEEARLAFVFHYGDGDSIADDEFEDYWAGRLKQII